MVVQEVVHSDLLSGGFPRFDLNLSLKGISDPDLLTQLTLQLASFAKATVPALTIELKADREPEFGSYGLGDAMTMYLNDPRHPDPVDRTYNTRVVGWEYYPPSDEHTEQARLTFQGGDL
jgi:hypothetical protein